MHSPIPRHNLTFSIWLGYIVFVVYGSLVPLDFNPHPLDEAWAIFQHIPMLKLGIDSRADWIANAVLYVPVGFLSTHLLMQKYFDSQRVFLFFLAGLFSIALAFGVEFAQIFFPPRSVTLNDLLAESIGSLIGVTLAARYSEWLKTLLQAMFSDPRRLALRLLEAYLVCYVAYSLFPYDILLSGAELEKKLQGNNWGWWVVGDPKGRVMTVLKLLSEAILAIPFGLFLGFRSAPQAPTYKQAALWGASLGVFIEIANLLTASGVSQGLSILTRSAGFCCGLKLWHSRTSWTSERIIPLAQRYALPLGAIYFLTLLHVNGWFSFHWKGIDSAVSQLSELHFLPFYYHYYTTEAKALFSLASICLMYLPIGLLTWAKRGSPSQAFFYALCVASLVETSKLFLEGLRPDPTNIMIGALASWGVLHLARTLSEASAMPDMKTTVGSQNQLTSPSDKSHPLVGVSSKDWAIYALVLVTLAFAAYSAATFPTQPVLLCLFFTACAAIIWHRPELIFAILPAALPILDLAPWSGRFYLDEFDLLVIISLVIGYTRIAPVQPREPHTNTLFAWASGLLAISFAISALRGLTPWQTPDSNSFTNYYSPFNALRIAKGALWAFLCYGLLRRLRAAGIGIKRPLALGMASGLALTVAVIIWERLTFVDLLDFASVYRVSGPFSAMHTGGAYIECFLATATPFLILLVLQTRNWASRLLGVFLLLATTYALMVTFSRNGYSAFGVAVSLILFFAVIRSGRWQHHSILVAAIAGAMLAVAIPVFTGQFAQARMATVGQDYGVRQNHWEDSLNMRTPNWLTTLFGMGLGRFPESHYLLSREGNQSGTYQLAKEDGNTYLRLVSGSPIYIEQLVSVEPRKKYVLKLDVRANKPNLEITLPICEKWLLTSYNCIWNKENIGKETGVWRHLEIKLDTHRLSISPWYSQRPIKLSLYNSNSRSIIDVDNVRLESDNGENLLNNGDFSDNLDHWFFSSDNHLQWHAKSLPVTVLFDQGWFGLLAFSLFSLLAIYRAARRAWQGDLHAAAALAAFIGFLVVGLFDTLIDAPRFLFLMILLGGFCGFGNSTLRKDRYPGRLGSQ